MNKKKNKTILLGISIAFCITLFSPTDATALPIKAATESIESLPRVEQTMWYYRVVNGIKQKRLWSITYGYWKTDWINI